jgi:hypothetical protein
MNRIPTGVWAGVPGHLRCLSLALALVALAGAADGVRLAPRARPLLAAKLAADDANFRNDQAGLRAAVAQLSALESDPEVGESARYHAAWAEWMIAAFHFQETRTADAVAALDSGCARLRRLLAAHPEDGEAHALLAWMLIAITSGDRTRATEILPEVREHHRRALALSPHSPRVVMLDATMLFYSPEPGAQAKGLARWQETLQLVDAEEVADSTSPDWGRTLADGWLANLYLLTKPPRLAEARAHAGKALRERPDWWWVSHEVLPRAMPPGPGREGRGGDEHP